MKRFIFLLISVFCMLTFSGCSQFLYVEILEKVNDSELTVDFNLETQHVHSFESWVTIEQATCETDGKRTRSCNCGEIQESVISATGHKWSKGDCVTAKICANCEKTDESEMGHTLENQICTKCKESFRTQEYIQSIIKIVNADIYLIDSAGGVSVDIGWENASEKTVKYVRFEVCAYNAVEDPVRCSIKGKYNMVLEHVGPVASGEKYYSIKDNGSYDKSNYVWDNAWYNDTAETIKIFNIRIMYMDGSEIEFNEKDSALAICPIVVTLSQKAEKIELLSQNIQFTVHGMNGPIKLEFGIVSDEGYYIKKYGTATVKLTKVKSAGLLKWDYLKVICEKTIQLDDSCYVSKFGNEVTLELSPGFDDDFVTFEVSITLNFGGDEKPINYTYIAYARII